MKIIKKITKVIAFVLLVSVLCTMGAFAIESEYATVTVGGYSYYIYSSITSDGSRFQAIAWIQTVGNENVPASTMGANGRLYDANGDLQSESGFSYNTGSNYFHFGVAEGSFSGSAYSKGQVRMRSGSGYITSECPATYNIPLSSSSASLSELQASLQLTLDRSGYYPQNSKGEAYGSALLTSIVGYEPDLIAAIGKNDTSDNVNGYIRKNFDPIVNTPEEAMKYMIAFNDNYRILPLYDVEGNEIGWFERTIMDDETVAEAKEALELMKRRAEMYEAAGIDLQEEDHITVTSDISRNEELMASLIDGDYPRNYRGETYGSALLTAIVGYEPDLIAAIGKNNTSDNVNGYIRKDFDPIVNTPEEAMEYMIAFNDNYRILPLYDVEGNEIGWFERNMMSAQTVAAARAALELMS